MFESPTGHFFRHVLLAYRDEGLSLKTKLEISSKLIVLEKSCKGFLKRNGKNERVESLLDRIMKMKANL
jgi:hypothetical protein